MESIEALIGSGGEITFAALFIALLYYVMKTNNAREQQYRDTISTLSIALSGYEDLSARMVEIQNCLNGYTKKIG